MQNECHVFDRDRRPIDVDRCGYEKFAAYQADWLSMPRRDQMPIANDRAPFEKRVERGRVIGYAVAPERLKAVVGSRCE